MRILIATAHQSIVGGVETYLRAALPLLEQAGHEVGAICSWPASETSPRINDQCPGAMIRIASDTDEAIAAAESWKPDVVYSHGLPDAELESALAGRFPSVYFSHNYVGTCISGSKCHSSPAPQPCTHQLSAACLARYLPRRCGGLNPVVAYRLYRINRRRQRLFGEHRAVLANSRHMAAELIRNGVPEDRTYLVPLFPTNIRPDPEPPAPKTRSDRILFVGRITALKGWRELLDAVPIAAAELGRRLTLVVAGDGPDRSAFEYEAKRRGVQVEFLGWVDAERRTAEMQEADLLAVPSVWPEPFGLVGIEAGCVGLPAAGFAVGGIPDWLIPGVSGELAPGERPNARDFAGAMVRALRDDTRLQKLRVGAWRTALQFTPEEHMKRLVPILEEAAQRPCGPIGRALC
jgi:glycosyltransferase involved in cell wall biosynthesis